MSLHATPRPSHYQAFLRRESSPEASKGGGRGVVNHLERVKTVFDSRSLVKHGTAATGAGSVSIVCLCRTGMPLDTSRPARRMPAAPFLQATTQPPPRLNCILPVLPCPEVIVSGAGTDGASWEKRLPQVPPSPEAGSRLEENAPLRKAHDSTVTILVRQEMSCELWPRPSKLPKWPCRLSCQHPRPLSLSCSRLDGLPL